MRSYRLAIDVFVVIWVAAMLTLGWLAMLEFDRLAGTADSLSGVAREESGLASALMPLESLPLTGDRVAQAERNLRATSTSTAADAEVMRGSLREVGRIAFGIVALIALFPVVVFYLPMRMPTVRSRLPDARGRHLTT